MKLFTQFLWSMLTIAAIGPLNLWAVWFKEPVRVTAVGLSNPLVVFLKRKPTQIVYWATRTVGFSHLSAHHLWLQEFCGFRIHSGRHRSFAISTLRDEGMAKAFLEPKILGEVEMSMEHFSKPNLGKHFSMALNLNQATANIVSQMILTRCYDYDDTAFNTLISSTGESFAISNRISMYESFPLGKYFNQPLAKREQCLLYEHTLPTMTSYIDREHPQDVMNRYFKESPWTCLIRKVTDVSQVSSMRFNLTWHNLATVRVPLVFHCLHCIIENDKKI